MTLFESWSLVIAVINIVIITGGLIFTYRQIKLTGEQVKANAEQTKLLVASHADNHEWNRRFATQEILLLSSSGKFDEAVSLLLEQDRTTPIPKEELFAKFKEHPELQTKTHIMLNFFEALARGAKYGIYDEDIIKNARRGTMKRSVTILREYIDHWRRQNYKYWIEHEQLVQKWDDEDIRKLGKAPIGLTK